MSYTTQQHQPEGLFEAPVDTPATGSDPSLPWGQINSKTLENWDQIKASGISPLHESSAAGAERFREEFIRGALMLGLDSLKKPLHPQQLRIADVLNACDSFGLPLNSTTAIEIPRRASKTTSIFAVLLGRCLCRPGYQVGFSAQTGIKTRDRFMKDIVNVCNMLWKDPDRRPFRFYMSRGAEQMIFENGSVFSCLPPQGESYRGDAYDAVFLDESQEYGVELTADLDGAIQPTFDTRPEAQLITGGTTGKQRLGMLFDKLELGREGKAGILEYAVPDTITADDLMTDSQKDWGKVEPLIRIAHPGIDTLTTIERMAENFETLPLPQFMREYLGIWPEDYSQGAIDTIAWRACAIDFIDKPAHFVIAFDVEPSGQSAAIVAAWRDSEHSYVELLDHRPGVEWLGAELMRLALKYRVMIGHDTIGAAMVEAEALTRRRPRPRLRPIGYKDVGPATASIAKDITERRLRHFDQGGLNDAVTKVAKRPLGDGSFGWKRRGATGDITPLIAATIAFRVLDNNPRSSSNRIITAKGA